MTKKPLFAKKFAPTIVILFLFLTSFNTPPSENTDSWFCNDLKNTYQIEVHNSRKQIAAPADICELISTNRKKSETVTIKLNENVFLKIFSDDFITANADQVFSQIVYL